MATRPRSMVVAEQVQNVLEEKEWGHLLSAEKPVDHVRVGSKRNTRSEERKQMGHVSLPFNLPAY